MIPGGVENQNDYTPQPAAVESDRRVLRLGDLRRFSAALQESMECGNAFPPLLPCIGWGDSEGGSAAMDGGDASPHSKNPWSAEMHFRLCFLASAGGDSEGGSAAMDGGVESPHCL